MSEIGQRTLFLESSELQALTGYTQPAAQVRWLQRNHVLHYVRADGRPIVPVSAIETARNVAAPSRVGPDLDAVRLRH